MTFKEPVVSPPFWRRAREDEFQAVFVHAQAHTQGEVVQVSSKTSKGNVVRLYHWRDLRSVVVVPAITPDPEE